MSTWIGILAGPLTVVESPARAKRRVLPATSVRRKPRRAVAETPRVGRPAAGAAEIPVAAVSTLAPAITG